MYCGLGFILDTGECGVHGDGSGELDQKQVENPSQERLL